MSFYFVCLYDGGSLVVSSIIASSIPIDSFSSLISVPIKIQLANDLNTILSSLNLA